MRGGGTLTFVDVFIKVNIALLVAMDRPIRIKDSGLLEDNNYYFWFLPVLLGFSQGTVIHWYLIIFMIFAPRKNEHENNNNNNKY